MQTDKRVRASAKYKSRKDPGNDLPVLNKVRCGEGCNIHFRVHTSNLSQSVFESLVVSVENISGQFSLSFFKPFGLLMKFSLRSPSCASKLVDLFSSPVILALDSSSASSSSKTRTRRDRTLASSAVTSWRLAWSSFER